MSKLIKFLHHLLMHFVLSNLDIFLLSYNLVGFNMYIHLLTFHSYNRCQCIKMSQFSGVSCTPLGAAPPAPTAGSSPPCPDSHRGFVPVPLIYIPQLHPDNNLTFSIKVIKRAHCSLMAHHGIILNHRHNLIV